MTIETTNLTKVIAQQSPLSQLPVKNSSSEQSSSVEKPDNVVRLNIEQRQNVTSAQQSTSETQVQTQTNQSTENIQIQVQELNQSIQNISRSLEFRVDKDSGKTVVTVRDSETDEVIRQIPSDKFLAISARLKELQDNSHENKAAGILFNGQI